MNTPPPASESRSYTAEDITIMRQAIANLESYLLKAEFNNAGTVTQILYRVFEYLGHSDLSEVEKLFRERGSRVHLVAVPIAAFGGEYESRLPGVSGTLKYALWACMNGDAEAKDMLRKRGHVTSARNLDNLAHCGFLSPVKN